MSDSTKSLNSSSAPSPVPSPALGGQVAEFFRNYYIYFVLAAIVIFLSSVNLDQYALFERGNFLYKKNVINILRVSAPLLVLAGAFTLLMVSGYIDLSVGSTMGLTAVIYASSPSMVFQCGQLSPLPCFVVYCWALSTAC